MLQPKDTDWLNGYKKRPIYICCLQETHFRPKDTYRLKVRGWKNIVHANGMQKKAGVAIFISDKIDLKIKKITRDKEGHYIMIKGSIQKEDITIVNINAPNIGAPQYIRQVMFKLVLEKAEEPEIKLPTSAGSLKKQESTRKTSISALLTMPKPLTVWITIN